MYFLLISIVGYMKVGFPFLCLKRQIDVFPIGISRFGAISPMDNAKKINSYFINS